MSASSAERAVRRARAGLDRPLLYRGKRLECPCCGGRFRRFKALPGRPDAQCPGCGSYERQRVLALYLSEQTDVFSTELDVLHFAPETAIATTLRALPNLRYVGADLSAPRGGGIEADITAIPFADASFDLILCSHVLEHVPDDRRAMHELHRVLRPGGRAILQHPIDQARERTLEDPSIVSPADRRRAFAQEDHVRVYGRDFGSRLAEAGFEVDVERYPDRVAPRLRQRYRLDVPWDDLYNGSDLYVCRRRDG